MITNATKVPRLSFTHQIAAIPATTSKATIPSVSWLTASLRFERPIFDFACRKLAHFLFAVKDDELAVLLFHLGSRNFLELIVVFNLRLEILRHVQPPSAESSIKVR